MFNQKAQKKNRAEWEKHILRINSLEVQMRSLLEFEKKVRTTMYQNNSEEKRTQQRGKPKEKDSNIETAHKIKMLNNKITELGQRVSQLEDALQRDDQTTVTPPAQELDERMVQFIEQLILEKRAVDLEREKQLVEKIHILEHQISGLHENRFSPPVASPNIESEDFSTGEHPNEERAEKEDFYQQIDMRVQLLERNLLLINEVQTDLLKRLDDLLQQNHNDPDSTDETIESIKQEEPILQTIYVDKLYLEKYEQNNNFAQLGIKSLSGELNIGATYGKGAVPKEVTDQVKEDMEKMKDMKADMKKDQPGTSHSEDFFDEESSSDVDSGPSEKNTPYTEIFIEDEEDEGAEGQA
ncbi:hypothetical protein M3181_24665 [Mesobacillus maritimus]|uniref:hypothetical protein n=1 Tax=Mesobacillus maritimus TaxID=1643336 RepID=UPI00203B126A|nr:hypothetical protein [Mesobacillus maritimus]MCM3672079.1 hypothetical protein [Mesobacillus maritimus]